MEKINKVTLKVSKQCWSFNKEEMHKLGFLLPGEPAHEKDCSCMYCTNKIFQW